MVRLNKIAEIPSETSTIQHAKIPPFTLVYYLHADLALSQHPKIGDVDVYLVGVSMIPSTQQALFGMTTADLEYDNNGILDLKSLSKFEKAIKDYNYKWQK